MAKKINWTFPAFEMLYEILEYKSEFNAINAEKYIDKVFAFCENFSTFPNSNPVAVFPICKRKAIVVQFLISNILLYIEF
jgi:plasmid stabilization system protein ParE